MDAKPVLLRFDVHCARRPGAHRRRLFSYARPPAALSTARRFPRSAAAAGISRDRQGPDLPRPRGTWPRTSRRQQWAETAIRLSGDIFPRVGGRFGEIGDCRCPVPRSSQPSGRFCALASACPACLGRERPACASRVAHRSQATPLSEEVHLHLKQGPRKSRVTMHTAAVLVGVLSLLMIGAPGNAAGDAPAGWWQSAGGTRSRKPWTASSGPRRSETSLWSPAWTTPARPRRRD